VPVMGVWVYVVGMSTVYLVHEPFFSMIAHAEGLSRGTNSPSASAFWCLHPVTPIR